MKKVLAASALLSVLLAPSAAFAQSLSRADNAFLSDYYQLISTIKNPQVRIVVFRATRRNPVGVIQGAKLICQSLRAGITMDEIIASRAQVSLEQKNPLVREASRQDEAIVETLAPVHYCPEQQ